MSMTNILWALFILSYLSMTWVLLFQPLKTKKIYVWILIQVSLIIAIFLGARQEYYYQSYERAREAWKSSEDYRHKLNRENLSISDKRYEKWMIGNRLKSKGKPPILETSSKWKERVRSQLEATFFTDFTNAYKSDPKEIVVLETKIVSDQIKRTFLLIPTFDGTKLPVYLFEPHWHDKKIQDKKYPAFVVVPGHGKGIIETAGIVESYQHGIALKLAEAGYITITPELRGFGYLGDIIENEHRSVAYNALRMGRSYIEILLYDMKNVFEYLRSHPQVNKERIGFTGVSFGGEISAYYTAIDFRVKGAIIQGWGGTSSVNRDIRKRENREQPHYCHLIPGLSSFVQKYEVFQLISPRPLLVVRGAQENYDMKIFEDRISNIYRDLLSPHLFNIRVPSGGHEYFVQPAIDFAMKHF